jgi:hypothetical protein
MMPPVLQQALGLRRDLPLVGLQLPQVSTCART